MTIFLFGELKPLFSNARALIKRKIMRSGGAILGNDLTPGPGGGGTPLYGLYRYVPRNRV